MKLTRTEQWVMDYLQDTDWTSPTDIGRAYGVSHSAWASPRCLSLVKKGLLERNERGHYRRTMQPISKLKRHETEIFSSLVYNMGFNMLYGWIYNRNMFLLTPETLKLNHEYISLDGKIKVIVTKSKWWKLTFEGITTDTNNFGIGYHGKRWFKFSFKECD